MATYLPVCLSVCMATCLSLCLSVSVRLLVSVCMAACACLSVCVAACVCLSDCLCVCLLVCLSVCLYGCLRLSVVSVCLSACLSVCVAACVCLSDCLSVWLLVSVSLTVCVCVYLSLCLCVYLSVCLYGCLRLSVVSVCLSACLSVCVAACVCLCDCLCVSTCLSVCLCRKRTCLNPILPHKSPVKKPLSSPSLTADQPSMTSASKVKRVVERKSYRAMLSPDSEKVKRSTAEVGGPKPGIDTKAENIETNGTGRRGHRLFGAKKFTSSSAALKRLKHKPADRAPLSSDPAWKRRADPWKKRRSLLASDRGTSGTSWSPRSVPSSSSLTSLSDTDGGGKHTLGVSQSRSLVKVITRFITEVLTRPEQAKAN